VLRHSSFIADSYVSDVFVGTLTDASADFEHSSTILNTEYVTKLFFNSYTVSLPTVFSNLDISYSLFWTGASAGLDGVAYPAFIRIHGYLSYSERINLKTLEVFFEKNLPFFTDTTNKENSKTTRKIYCDGSIEVECTASYGIYAATNTFTTPIP